MHSKYCSPQKIKGPQKLPIYYRYLLSSPSLFKKQLLSVELQKLPGITCMAIRLIVLLPFLIHKLRYDVLCHSMSVHQTYKCMKENAIRILY